MAGYDIPTVFESWQKSNLNFSWILKLIEERKEINTFELREALYNAVKSEPSTFKATVSKALIQFFQGKRILDFCAGWGDRLLGALARQNEIEYYYGVDPNKLLHPNYQMMIKEFAAEDNLNKFQMIVSAFEKWQIPTGKTFDLILGGPPYYDYEKYGENDEEQSIRSYPTIAEWTVRFLFGSIKKCWDVLEEGGHMLLNVNDVRQLAQRDMVYTEAMNLFIQCRFPDAKYEGIICFAGANYKAHRPIWIYKKDSQLLQSKTQTHSKEAETELSTNYPHYYREMKKWEQDQTSF